MARRARLLAWVAFLLFLVAPRFAVPLARADEPGSEYDIAVLTMGPGDHPFTKFGHTAVLVENRVAHTRKVYNYGAFSFDSIWLIPKFLTGKYRYWLAVDDYRRTLAYYAAYDRKVSMQRLALDASEKRRIVELLQDNAREENKYYVFDYYRDNCSTRVRDLLDRVLDGALAQGAGGPARLTWRGHTRRLTAGDLPVYFGLYAAMGDVIDRPITVWQEMFLPSVLEEQLRHTVREGALSGPLVSEEIVLVGANRPAPLRDPPRFAPWLALVGIGIAACLALLARSAGHGNAAARFALGGWLSLFGLAAGLLGLVFALLWAFTNHDVAHHNENLFQCAPFGLLLVVPAARAAAGRRPSHWLVRLTALGAACSLLGLPLKALPWFDQDNLQVIALFLPLWLGSAWAARGLLAIDQRAPIAGAAPASPSPAQPDLN